jgi:hypothetical protein
MARGGVILPILSEFKPQGLDKAIREFEKLEKTSDKIAFGLKKSFVPAAAVVGGLTAGFVKLSAAAETASTSNARIVQVAESMALFGDETQQVTDRLIKLAEQTARNTGVDQNAIKETQAKLLTFKELAETADVVGGSFDRATQAAIDLAAAGFGEATTNAVQLGKALNDPIKGITALTRSGVTFTAAEQDRIRVLVESNKVGEAQTLILEAIEKQVGGTAEATANASDKMNVSFSLMQEKLGTALLPIFEKFTQIMIGVFDFVSANQKVFLVLAGAIGAVATAIVAANVAMKVYTGLQAVVKVANTVMGTSFQLTAGKMLKFSGILGGVGIAIGLGTVAYNLYRREKERLAGITDDFTRALEAERGGQEGATDAVIVAALASEQMQERIAAAGLTSVDVAKAIRGETTPAFDEFAEKMAFATEKGIAADEQQRRLSDAFGDGGGKARALYFEVDKLRNSYEAANNQVELTESVTKDLQSAQETLADTFRSTDDTSKAMADSMAAAEAAMAAYEDQTRAANDALQAMMDTTLAMFDADLNLEAQIARTEQAVFDYAEALANGSLKGRDLEAAQRGVKEEALRQADAAVKAAEAQAELAGQTLDASDRQRIMVESLAAVADALDPADPLRRQLVDYIQQLGLIPSVKETVIRTIREEIVQQSIVQAQQFSPAAIAAASRTPRVSRNIGGPVPGILNTSTPIMAHGGEYVLSADVVDAIKRGAPSRGLGRGSAAGDGGGNVINVTVTSADPQAVVDAIRRYNRSNGPAPIRVAS